MSSGDDRSDQTREERSLVRKESQEHPMASVNTGDLLGEALRRMSPEKAQELMNKAGEEALRIQAMGKEEEVHSEVVARNVDDAIRKSSDPAARDSEFSYRYEHQSKHSRTEVNIRNQGKGLEARCFVATACYGDESHPVVVDLRQYRDAHLMTSASGRLLVRIYYTIGPTLASALEKRPHLRPRVARLLEWLVRNLPGRR